MFVLDRAIEEWSTRVHESRCGTSRAASVEELRDHLHCEIERARTEGLADEEAFAAAVARLGSAAALAAEHGKNRSPLGAACAVLSRADRSGPRGPRLAHALVWAALILSSAAFLSRSAMSRESSLLVTGLFVPVWWASDQLLRSVLRARPGGRVR